MIDDSKTRRLLLLTDDEFLAEVLGTYMRRDLIELERVATAEDAGARIMEGADGVLVDLAKRGCSGEAVMTLSNRAQRWEIPMLILSTQTRRDLKEFAVVVRATEIVSKTEPITAIAARIRMIMRTPMRPAKKEGVPAQRVVEYALA